MLACGWRLEAKLAMPMRAAYGALRAVMIAPRLRKVEVGRKGDCASVAIE
jgi:hypothetical protein